MNTGGWSVVPREPSRLSSKGLTGVLVLTGISMWALYGGSWLAALGSALTLGVLVLFGAQLGRATS